jgi:cytochrome c biogenesis protein CcmG, thiol:disulfide interchange protein DsbE
VAGRRAWVARRGRGPPLKAGRIRSLDLSRLPRWWLIVAAVLPLLLVVAIVAALAGPAVLTPAVRIGDRAPDFALADLDGRTVRLSDYEGRPVIVNFWASWCLPCRDEFPLFDAALREHADEGLAVVGIVYRDRSEAARAFAEQLGADWPLVMDPGETVARAYGVFGPPESWLIGPDGRVVSRQIGPYTAPELEAGLARVLGSGSAED